MAAVTKVWVRRPNSSPTRITIPSTVTTPNFFSPAGSATTRDTPQPVEVEFKEDFLVDDLREVILKKYPQSLGKHHDTADLAIRIPVPRHDGDEGRILSPEESVVKILSEEFPNGQKSSEAWVIVTSGGRDNYTRWWLQTGGFSNDLLPLRGTFSPTQFIPGTGGSYGSELVHQQEYFPYMPQTVVSPPGEFPPGSRASRGSSMMSVPRTQGRPPLRQARTTLLDAQFPGRRYEGMNTSSMVVESPSGAESEISRARGRDSPDSTALSGLRYPPNIRPSSAISGRNTPPSEYANRARQYTQGNKQPSTSVPGQPFQMQLPSQKAITTIPQKVASPLGGPPIISSQQRLPSGSAARPVLTNALTSSPAVSVDKPTPQTTSPKSPGSGNGSSNGGPPGTVVGPSTSPITRRKSNTLSTGSVLPNITIPKSQSPPSPIAERTESPRPPRVPFVKSKSEKDKNSALGVIPPINVLIVEDNIINAQILEVFFRKRKLQYATAVNGKEAVEKWRQGGWHLVLMDIQLPVMSGIEATKEIRRLERVNHIGVFSEEKLDAPSPGDELGDLPFPSPVIIVALTASSRESDRNEALAAGCNDFLTKPVGAPWLERKAIEWGCMQALIWTSLERKKRRSTVGEGAGEDGKEGMGGTAEKPPVVREDSGDSVKTVDSSSTDEGQRS